MKRKKAFLLYHDSYDTIRFLDDEQLGKLTRLIFEYKLYGTFPDPSNMLFFVFNPIKLQLDRDNESYLESIEAKSKAGKKSAESKALKQLQQSSTESTRVESVEVCSTESTDNDNVNDNVIVSVKVNDIINSAKAPNYTKFTNEDLIDQIKPFIEKYGKDFCNKFYSYWSEPLPNGKMRMTGQKAWNINRRLVNWKQTEKQPTNTFVKSPPVVFNRSSQGQHYVGDDVI
jgi:hypothetical protein